MSEIQIDDDLIDKLQAHLEQENAYFQPVAVSRDGDQLTIRAGLERFIAAERSDEIGAIPVCVTEGDTDE